MMQATLVKVQIATILSIHAFICCTASSASKFYQPGHGALVEWWLTDHTWNYYNTSVLNEIVSGNKDFRKCPLFAANADSFEHTFTDKGRLQYGRYRAYFIAPQTGRHSFFAIFNSRCEIYLTKPPKSREQILSSEEGTYDRWSERRNTGYYELMKGFGYLIEVVHYAYGDQTGFFRLGVTLPNSQQLKPIGKQYLWRSMSFYKWQGLLVEKYNSINFPSWESYSLSNVISMNAVKYPDHPSSYHCKSTLYDESPNKYFGNNYALRYNGYIRPAYDARYKMQGARFKLQCDEMCQFNLTTVLGPQQFLIRNYATPGSVAIGKTFLYHYTYYPVKVFMAEANNGGYLRVTYEGGRGGNGVEKNWENFLYNFNSAKSFYIRPPAATVKNQTYIEVELRIAPTLPSEDNWKLVQKYDLFYHQDGNDPYTKVEFNGKLPVIFDLTGLKSGTTYTFYARYYGYANNSTALNFISGLRYMRTAEDVPEKPPASIFGSSATSSSIRMTWDYVPAEFRHGRIRGYKIYFKESSKKAWGNPITTHYRTHYIAGLKYWTYYDVKISAFTTPGEGPTSSVVTVRTAEHSPTAAPASFMTYEITDAKIALKWKEISTEYRNGIITGYSIMFKKTTAKLWQEIKVPAGKTTWTTDALILSTSYELMIAGKTAGGIGYYSDVIVVKTDAGRLIEVMPTAYFTSLDFTDKVLTKHISKTIQVTTIEQCFRACLDCMKPNSGCSCSSFNIRRPSSPSTSFACEINASDHDACPFDFVKESGYQYYQIL